MFSVTIRKIISLIIAVLVVCSFAVALVACEPDNSNPSETPTDGGTCQHSLAHTQARGVTCTQNGNIEYWQCSKCNKYFSDANATNEIAGSAITVVSKHELIHYTANVATCTEGGNIEYWQCSKCDKTFADENANNEIDISDVGIEATGHVVGSEWKSDENGHWQICSACTQRVNSAHHTYVDYVCTTCEHEDENKPITQEEIVAKVTAAIEPNMQRVIGRNATINKYIALDFVDEGNSHYVYALVDIDVTLNGKTSNGLSFSRTKMAVEMSEENLKNNKYLPTDVYSGELLLNIPKTSKDDRGELILEKLGITSKIPYDLVSVTNLPKGVVGGLGGINGVDVYAVNSSKIIHVTISARSDGNIKDPIGESILNGTNIYEDSGGTFGFKFEDGWWFCYEFSGKAIWLGL